MQGTLNPADKKRACLGVQRLGPRPRSTRKAVAGQNLSTGQKDTPPSYIYSPWVKNKTATASISAQLHISESESSPTSLQMAISPHVTYTMHSPLNYHLKFSLPNCIKFTVIKRNLSRQEGVRIPSNLRPIRVILVRFQKE